MIERTPYLVDGKPFGMFCRYPDGKCLFVVFYSGAKNKNLHVKKNAWMVNSDALYAAERFGATAICIAHKVRSQVTYYVTNLADFWNEPSETIFGKRKMQRALHRGAFKVNTSSSAETLETAALLH